MFLPTQLQRTLFRALPGGIFLLSAGLKLFSVEEFELYLFSLELFSFDVAAWGARLIVGVEALLGVMLLAGWRERTGAVCSLVLLGGFSLWLLWRILVGDRESCHCMGALVEMRPTLSLLKNLLIALPLVGLLHFPKPKERLWPAGRVAAAALTLLSLPFLLFPPDAWYRYQEPHSEVRTKPFNELLHESGLEKDDHLLLFLSTECPYCQKMMRKVASILHRHPADQALIHALFLATSEEMTDPINSFYKEAKSPLLSWSLPHPRTLLAATGGALPLVVLIREGEVVAEYDYRTLSEEEIAAFLAPEQ